MRKWLAGVLILWLMLPAHALTPDEILPDPELEARARALSAELRCLVCQNQSIDDSDAPLARDLRTLIREHLVKGESDGQIMDYVVARYGEFVLLKPRFGANTMLLWGLPFAVLAAAALMLVFRRRQSAALPEAALSEAEQSALRKALEQPQSD